jgi:WD40 repeat protein
MLASERLYKANSIRNIKLDDSTIKLQGDSAVSTMTYIGATAAALSVHGNSSHGGYYRTYSDDGMNSSTHSRYSANSFRGLSDELLVVGSNNGCISVFDINTGKCGFRAEGHHGKVATLVALRSNEFISGGNDRSIKLWDLRVRRGSSFHSPQTPSKPALFSARSLGASDYRRCALGAITALAVGGWDNSLVISASADGLLRIWDLRYDINAPCSILKGHSNRISSISWNGRNEFHTASHDGVVRSWDSITGRCTNLFKAYENSEGVEQMVQTVFSLERKSGPSLTVNRLTGQVASQRSCLVTCSCDGRIRSFNCDLQPGK